MPIKKNIYFSPTYSKIFIGFNSFKFNYIKVLTMVSLVKRGIIRIIGAGTFSQTYDDSNKLASLSHQRWPIS